MLLEFRAKNFKSFADELVFSMIPAPKQRDLYYSVAKEKIGSKVYKGLSTAVIYGPNASGKSNIIGAMEVFKHIILRGNIRNDESLLMGSDAAANLLELIPNRSDGGNRPVDFSIKFIDSGLLLEYKLSLDLGGFLNEGYKRKVLSEMLLLNEKHIFSRHESLEINLNELNKFGGNELDEDAPRMLSKLAKRNLADDELFLTNGFKVIFSPKLVDLFLNWIDNKFLVFFRSDSLRVKPSKSKKDTIVINKTVDEAAKIFGINSNGLGYISRDEESEPKLVSLLGDKILNAEMYESYGTVRFVNIFPVVIRALIEGGTLVIDEFDASLHPMALMNIINIFHSDDYNKRKAQLIFNTHNPIFLNPNLFRRDEIKFVERDDETFRSTHYSLSDFGTSGEKGVRNGSDYMNNYFINQYGAIKNIDFTPVIEKLLENRGEE